MMKKRYLILFVLLLVPFLHVEAKDAKTLAELRTNLKALQNEKAKSDSSVKYTKTEIQKQGNEIAGAREGIDEAENKIIVSLRNIAISEEKLMGLANQAKDLMAFFELMSNNDSTYEYITNSSSMTELIMRQEAVNLVSSSYENKLKTLEGEIVSLEKQELELKALQIQLEKDIVTYEAKLKKLNYNLSSLVEITEDIDDQIKNQKALISYYEGIGCKENQSLDECEGIANNRGWLKPLVKGYISSDFGYRKDPITGANSSFHNGIDIAVGDGTKVYSATNGRVAAITVRSSCGGNKVYVYSKVDGQNYTVIYLHLLRIDVKVGQAVTTETIIGLSGGGSTSYKRGGYDTCTTGAHLHFGVAKGFYLTDYHSYASLVAKSIKPPGFPGKYGTFYSRTQWFN